MSLVYQVLSLGDLDEVYRFAGARLEAEVPDETERAFRSWAVRWRKEALEHYLRLGWSFVARRETKKAGSIEPRLETVGFFLAQPLLFFRGQTQTVWVEHLSAVDETTREALVDVAVKVAREKHIQRVLFSEPGELSASLAKWKPQILGTTMEAEKIAEVKTTKG